MAKPLNPDYPCLGTNSDSGYFTSSIAATNHSSLFETVPQSVRRGVTVREVFGLAVRKPLCEAQSPLAFAEMKISAEPRP